jgi:hypothetical protein
MGVVLLLYARGSKEVERNLMRASRSDEEYYLGSSEKESEGFEEDEYV